MQDIKFLKKVIQILCFNYINTCQMKKVIITLTSFICNILYFIDIYTIPILTFQNSQNKKRKKTGKFARRKVLGILGKLRSFKAKGILEFSHIHVYVQTYPKYKNMSLAFLWIKLSCVKGLKYQGKIMSWQLPRGVRNISLRYNSYLGIELQATMIGLILHQSYASL